jgi:hypothetical protein
MSFVVSFKQWTSSTNEDEEEEEDDFSSDELWVDHA